MIISPKLSVSYHMATLLRSLKYSSMLLLGGSTWGRGTVDVTHRVF